jgi:hypothetical protein
MHPNAKGKANSRLVMVLQIEKEGWSVTEAAFAAGMSERRAYEWLRCYREGGQAGGVIGFVLDPGATAAGHWRCIRNFASGTPAELTVDYRLPGPAQLPVLAVPAAALLAAALLAAGLALPPRSEPEASEA